MATSVWQHGEQGAAPTSLERRRRQHAARSRTCRTADARGRDLRSNARCAANFGVHAGFVWRRIDQLYQSDNLNRPVSAFNVPITVRDPGPRRHADGERADDCRRATSNPANLALPVVNFLHNTPGKDDFYNLELSANRRMSGGWSLNASYCVSLESRQRQRLFRPEPARQAGRGEPERHDQHRQRPLRVRPVVGQDQRHVRGAVGSAAHAGVPAAAGPAVSPGRSRSTMNYGAQRFLAEPIRIAAAGQHLSWSTFAWRRTSRWAARRSIVGLHRRLQPDQHERRAEHQLGFRRRRSCSRRRSSRRGCGGSASKFDW